MFATKMSSASVDKLGSIMLILERIEANQKHLLRLLEERSVIANLFSKLLYTLDSSMMTSPPHSAQRNRRRRAQIVKDSMCDLVTTTIAVAQRAQRDSQVHAQDATKLARRSRLDLFNESDSEDDAFIEVEPLARKNVHVDLDGIEMGMRTSHLLLQCKAFGRPDAIDGQAVYCAVVPMPGVHISELQLKLHARSRLSREQQPRQFFLLENLPKHVTRSALAGAYGPSSFVTRSMASNLTRYQNYVAYNTGKR